MHKWHRRQARQGAAGAGRTEDETGDNGLSGSGSSIEWKHCPTNLEASVGESVAGGTASCKEERSSEGTQGGRSGVLQ